MSLYAQTYALDIDVGEAYLELSYPQGNSSSSFSFLVATNGWGGKRDVASWKDVEGINVNVSGTVDMAYTVEFGGMQGGKWKPVNEFEFWNFTYGMPEGSGVEAPRMRLEFELVA
jgi:hypothetical protein